MRAKPIVIIASAVIVVLAAGAGAAQLLKSTGIWSLMRDFTVTVTNETDSDIVILESGLGSGDSRDVLNRTVKSGETYKFKPKLDVQGENSVYMAHTNTAGETIRTTVCGYTEYLSGSAKVTVGDSVEVEQDCH